MSLDTRIDGLSADLPVGASLDLVLNNPHFDYAKMAGTVVALPQFPLSRRNQFLFGYWEQPQAGAILARKRLEQYYNGHLIREALFVLTEAGPNGYTGAMVENLGEFFGDWQTRLLSELDFGTTPTPAVLPAAGIALDGQTALVFPTIINPGFYGTNGGAISYSGKVNEFTGGAYTATGPKVPMVLLKWLLQKIAMATNTTIDGALLTHPAYSQLLLYNTRALDGAAMISPAKHLPELTVVDLLLELRKLFNLRLSFDLPNRRLTLGFWADALRQPARLDWSQKAVGRPVKTPETNSRLQLGYELDGGDALMKDKPPVLADYISPGNGGLAALRSRISTLLMDGATSTAKAAQPGITAQFGQGSNSFGPRLLFWNPVAGVPLATNARNGFSLAWLGVGGLYENHWREMEQMRAGQFYAKQAFWLTETDLAQLDFGQKIHNNGVDYFVLSVAVSLPITKPAECLLVAG